MVDIQNLASHLFFNKIELSGVSTLTKLVHQSHVMINLLPDGSVALMVQGVDTRYANYYGRTLKLKAEYKF